MKRLFIVHGMKRSGNHAVLNWLKAHDHFIHFNNVYRIAMVLDGEIELPNQPYPYRRWLKARYKEKGMGALFPFERLSPRSYIASFEDHRLDWRAFEGAPLPVVNMIIIRDIENLMASRIKKGMSRDSRAYPTEHNDDMQRVIDTWKMHARECLGETQHIPDSIVIPFNRWFSDQSFRRELAEQLGYTFTDEGLSKVSTKGDGSSFDQTNYDNRGQKMDVLDRVQRLSEQERAVFDSVMDDPELQDLNRRLFSD